MTPYNIQDVEAILKSLKKIRLRADGVYDLIIRYIVENNLLQPGTLSLKEESYFLNTVFLLHGNLNNPAFTELMKQIIMENLFDYESEDLMRLIDIFKYS